MGDEKDKFDVSSGGADPEMEEERPLLLLDDDAEPRDGRAWYVVHCYSGL